MEVKPDTEESPVARWRRAVPAMTAIIWHLDVDPFDVGSVAPFFSLLLRI